ncbi:MAG: hypothetical protein KatS3mg057_1655 [Herpetosiphonaceae bacterium]|nr:MAG: hypothetical protein KatS3mg057_1655 [Herpetosiphonaceae bacterium]
MTATPTPTTAICDKPAGHTIPAPYYSTWIPRASDRLLSQDPSAPTLVSPRETFTFVQRVRLMDRIGDELVVDGSGNQAKGWGSQALFLSRVDEPDHKLRGLLEWQLYPPGDQIKSGDKTYPRTFLATSAVADASGAFGAATPWGFPAAGDVLQDGSLLAFETQLQDLQPGTYKLRSRAVSDAASCQGGEWEETYYLRVEGQPITVRLEQYDMAGRKLAAVGNTPFTINIRQYDVSDNVTVTSMVTETTASGSRVIPWEAVAPATGRVELDIVPGLIALPTQPNPALVFLWAIDTDCVGGEAVLDQSGSRAPGYYTLRNGCTLVFKYIERPSFSIQLWLANQPGQPEAPFAYQEVILSDLPLNRFAGTPIAPLSVNVQTDHEGIARFLLTGTQARPRVGDSQLRLMPFPTAPERNVNFWDVYYLSAVVAGTNATQVGPAGNRNGTAVERGAETYLAIEPAGPSHGNQFHYVKSLLNRVELSGAVLCQSGQALPDWAELTLTVTDTTNGVKLFERAQSTRSGFAFDWIPPFSAPAQRATLRVTLPEDTSLVDIQPGTDGIRRVDDTLVWDLEDLNEDRTSANNRLIVSCAETPPPPPAPPTATGDLYLHIHSTYDPQRGVYRSTTQEISWPQGEVLDFTPFVQLAPLPVAPPGWQYRQTVVAWSLVSTTVNGKERAAAAKDDLQRSGCRQRAEPPDNPAADLSGLLGCHYHYLDAPTSAEMARQAHSYWAAFLPPQMRDDVYVYRLAPIQPVYLRVQVAVLVEVLRSDGTPALEPVTGRPLRQTQILEQTFKVNLVVPRSAR